MSLILKTYIRSATHYVFARLAQDESLSRQNREVCVASLPCAGVSAGPGTFYFYL